MESAFAQNPIESKRESRDEGKVGHKSGDSSKRVSRAARLPKEITEGLQGCQIRIERKAI